RMLRERRTTAADLASLISLVVLGVVLVSSGKDTFPGAWYLLMISAAWSPLIAKEIATKENFFTRAARITFGVGFVVTAVTFAVLRRNESAFSLVPGPDVLITLIAVIVVTGGIDHAVLKRQLMPWEQRIQPLVSGAIVAYFLVMDAGLLR